MTNCIAVNLKVPKWLFCQSLYAEMLTWKDFEPRELGGGVLIIMHHDTMHYASWLVFCFLNTCYG